MSWRAAIVLLVSLLSGCGPSETPSTGSPFAIDGCSELTRAIARWQNRESDACGGAQVEMRTLVPIPANASFMIWTPVDRSIDTWALGADDTFGSDPAQLSAVPQGGSNLILMALGADRGVVYDQQSGNIDVWKLDLDAAHGAKAQFTKRLFKRAWLALKEGRDLIALDETHFLDLRPGTGDYAVVAFDRGVQTENLDPFDTHVGGSGRKEAFQRGHRLVVLPQNRLLEWVPARHEYRVWSYDLGRLPGDIFDATPAFEGSGGIWASLEADRELVSAGANRIAVWDRTHGTLEVHALEPLAPDPVAPEALGATRHDRLLSLLPGAPQPSQSRIRRLVLVFPQGRSFDALFGGLCQAEPGSDPTCQHDLTCCERMPASTRGADAPWALGDDGDSYVPNQSFECLREKMNGGAMDQFASGSPSCGDPRAFARLQSSDAGGPMAAFSALAARGTLGDRFFTSIADLAVVDPAQVNMLMFGVTALRVMFGGNQGEDSIGILAAHARIPWSVYLTDPPTTTLGYSEPLYFDGRWAFIRYLEELPRDAALGQLPQVSVVVPYADDPAAIGRAPDAGLPDDPRAGAAGTPGSLSRSAALISEIADAIAASPYAEETLILVAYLTSGGFYDHVAPPRLPEPGAPTEPLYGPRAPFLAIGPFVRKGGISHTPLEISSLTKFIEWNWLGGTGQLGGRDRTAGNLGGLLLPETTGYPIP